MTTNELDSADQYRRGYDNHSDDDNNNSDHSHKQSRRNRLKGAFTRTKTKIQHKVQEELHAREARKNAKEQDQQRDQELPKLDGDVDDFLAAGRPSFASSQRPSFTSDSRFSTDGLSPSPRPSTSDSKSQASPRRGPPMTIPRIDVSTSQRFPNARGVNPDSFLTPPGSDSPIQPRIQASLLKPEYKSRSQSTSSIAGPGHRARVRGLSVGFTDSPPVIIGEGGDEAQAPPVEISRAKARARSASPQGRRPYPDSPPDTRTQGPVRAVRDNSINDFVPKPFTRTQTGISPMASASLPAPGRLRALPRGPHDDDLVPRSFTQFQPGPSSRFGGSSRSNTQDFQKNDFVQNPISRAQTDLSDSRNPPLMHRTLAMHRSTPPQFQHQLAPLRMGTSDLSKEFDMSLGISSSSNSPPDSRSPPSEEPLIIAPKPKRAPPSYELIEGGADEQRENVQSTLPPRSIAHQVPDTRPNPSPQPSYQQSVRATSQPPPQGMRRQVTQDLSRPIKSRTPSDFDRPLRKPIPSPQPQPQPQPQLQSLQPLQPQLQPQPTQQNNQPLIQDKVAQNPPISSQVRPPSSEKSSQEYYPPPPQRQPTYIIKNIHQLPFRRDRDNHQPTVLVKEPVPRQSALKGEQFEPFERQPLPPSNYGHQETNVVVDRKEEPLVKNSPHIPTDDEKTNRSFAQRKLENPKLQTHSNSPTAVRSITSNDYEASPEDYSGSPVETPRTATEPSLSNMRFYSRVNTDMASKSFI